MKPPPATDARLLGLRIDARPVDVLVASAEQRRADGRQTVFACANPHSLVVAAADAEFAAALDGAEQVVADGVGVTLALRSLRRPARRITGSDYFHATMTLAAAHGRRVFLFGSTQETLARLGTRLAADYPGAVLCGAISPPFGRWDAASDAAFVAQIEAARPDVLWVALTAPRQEKWVAAQRARLTVPVIGCVGAVFDFVAGTHPRAPQWMCRAGLEWLHRLLREPRRMWQRSAVSLPRYALLLLRHELLQGARGAALAGSVNRRE